MATEEHALIFFPELSDGGQIKVVHFDTKICQGDFGCNERSFLEVMQKQWKHFRCAFRCRLGVRNEHTTNHPFGVLKLVLSYLKQHRQDAFKGRRFFHYPPFNRLFCRTSTTYLLHYTFHPLVNRHSLHTPTI